MRVQPGWDELELVKRGVSFREKELGRGEEALP